MKYNNKSEFIVQDFDDNNWYKKIKTAQKFDLIMSGFSIHHINNEQKKRLYTDIYTLLKPGGIFLNLEHVLSPTNTIEELFNDLFLDSVSDYQRHIGDEKQEMRLRRFILILIIKP